MKHPDLQLISDRFIRTVEDWRNTLDRYNFAQLCMKPDTTWSLGQVIMHLKENTNHYWGEVKSCVSSNQNANKLMSREARAMFHNNAFPDIVIEGPPSNRNTPQPASKEQLIHYFISLEAEIPEIRYLILHAIGQGKTKHPGLNYFDANEWFQFAEMHFRHHLRQKARIEKFLS